MSRAYDYDTTVSLWRSEENIYLRDAMENFLALIPISFLQVPTHNVLCSRYLWKVARAVAHVPGDAKLFRNGEEIGADERVHQGQYDLISESNPTLIFRRGPQGKTGSRNFSQRSTGTSVSHSSRSTPRQARFRNGLRARDYKCVVSGNHSSLIASHIVPFSLGQQYLDDITGIRGLNQLYSIQNGLLLRRDIHDAYDRYEIGFFCDNSRCFVHTFGESYREFHGKEVAFPTIEESRRPDIRLLDWHYSQCLMTRFRGYEAD